MAAPGHLPSLVSVVTLFLAPRIERVGCFVASSNACSTFAPLFFDAAGKGSFCRETSPPAKMQRTRHIYQPSAIESTQGSMGSSLQPQCLYKQYRQSPVALKLLATGAATPAAEGNILPAKPSWVDDPDEDRVKMWMRSAGRKGEHDRVAMYLRKYREGKARKGKVPSVDIYNAALRALDECHKWKLALSVFREMQADGVAADRNSYFFAISACSRRGEVRAALELLAEMRASQAEGGPAPDLLLYAVAVKACAGGKSWREAFDLLDEMSAAGVRPNVVVVNTVLSACAKCAQIERAKELLRDMKENHGVDPDVVSYNSVISGHERAGEWREAMALAREMERSEGISPNVVTFNSVIGACKRAGRPMEALAVLGLLRRKGLRPDVISYNSAMSACASAGKWEEALELLDLMPSEGVKPDLTTCNIALDACVKSGQWEIALSLFEELATSSDPSLAPDLYTYNTLMAVFSNSGQLPRALDLLEEAMARGLRPDVITYSTLIRACERASPPQPEVALQLVVDMETAGVRPNNTTFVSIALSLGRAGRALDCLGVLQGMRERGTPPDAICCQTVLRVFDRWDRAEEATELFEDMRSQGLAYLPEVAEEMYCCGIRALEKLGRWSAAVALLEEWRSLDGYSNSGKDNTVYDQWYQALRLLAGGDLVEYTDAKTARAAIVSAARGGLAEQALAIMRKMDAMGFELGAVDYGAVMEALERSGKPERGLEIFDEMVACGVEPDVLCFAAATRCYCKRGDWESAIVVLEATLRKGLLPASRTVQAVARLCGKAGKYESLWDIKELMRNLVKGGGMARPGSSIYASLIQACGSAGRPDLVLRCLAEMSIDQSPGRDWRVPVLDEPSTMSAAVGALLACNETAEADRIYADAIRRGVFPDPVEGRTWTAAALRARTATAIATVISPAESGAMPRGEDGSGSFPGETTPLNTRERQRFDGGHDGRGRSRRRSMNEPWSSVEDAAFAGAGGDGEDLLLWVDLRRSPVSVVPSAVRRVIQAMKKVGDFSEGLVVQWGGAQRTEDGYGYTAEGGGRARNGGGNAGHAGRRETVLAAFGCIKPPIKVTEPFNKRGQMFVEKEELQRWLREVRVCEGGQSRRRSR